MRTYRRAELVVALAVSLAVGGATLVAVFVAADHAGRNGAALAIVLLGAVALTGTWLITTTRWRAAGLGVLIGAALAAATMVVLFISFVFWLGGQTT